MKISKEAEKEFLKTTEKITKKRLEDILQKPKPDKDDEKILQEVSRVLDDTSEAKAISNETLSFGDKLNDANLDSFEKVERMYRVGFYTGVVLVGSAIGLFVYNAIQSSSGVDTTTGNIISGVLGSLGVADMLLLLYTPVRELQKSRGNISKLSALFNEWQYISLWSGKTYNVLIERLRNKEKIDANTEKLLNEMRQMLELKSDTTIKLAKLMGEIITHYETSTLKVTINAKPEKPEVNTKVELEANVYGISTSEAEKITYSWTEESNKITINNKDKRKGDFIHDKAGEYNIQVEVKVGNKQGSAVSKITIKHKVTAKAEPEKTEKDKDVKLIVKIEGLDEETTKKLFYKWEQVEGTSITITNDDKSEASIKPKKPGNYEFKVTITKDSKEFAEKNVKVEVT